VIRGYSKVPPEEIRMVMMIARYGRKVTESVEDPYAGSQLGPIRA